MEELCRDILESIYSVPFKPNRPNFLKNPETGRNLELDGYNKELKIAFEYNGDHLAQMKKELCIRFNIYLVSIPYNIPKKDIRTYIVSQLPRDYRN